MKDNILAIKFKRTIFRKAADLDLSSILESVPRQLNEIQGAVELKCDLCASPDVEIGTIGGKPVLRCAICNDNNAARTRAAFGVTIDDVFFDRLESYQNAMGVFETPFYRAILSVALLHVVASRYFPYANSMTNTLFCSVAFFLGSATTAVALYAVNFTPKYQLWLKRSIDDPMPFYSLRFRWIVNALVIPVAIGAVTAASSYILAHLSNCVLDPSPEKAVSMIKVSERLGWGWKDMYAIDLQSTDQEKMPTRYVIRSSKIHAKIPNDGALVKVVTKDGRLNIPWIVRVEW